MPSRIDVELTSRRDDETWTWRAAGARQPKGVVDAAIVPAEASTGDVLRAEVEFGVDGILVLSLGAVATRRRHEPERIEIRGSRSEEPAVTTQLVAKRGKGARRDRSDDRGGDRAGGDRDRRGDRAGGDRDRRGDRNGGDRTRARSDGRSDRRDGRPGAAPRDRRDRPARPQPPERPRSKRLKPQRVHRQALLRQVVPEQRPMAEIVLRGGIPGVRQTIDRMNEAAREHGQPPVAAEPLLALAEKLLPHLRMAEWHDRADAALAEVDELDLRDLRQVVVAADANARDETTRDLAGQLRSALTRRVDSEHALWLEEITALLDDGRVVRALRLSSRPPKAGARFPAELAARLAEATSAALAADTLPDRYATVLDALAFAPVRTQVVPAGVPARANDDLLTAVRKLADRLPQVAAAFGLAGPVAAPAPPVAAPAPPVAAPAPENQGQAGSASPEPAGDDTDSNASLTS